MSALAVLAFSVAAGSLVSAAAGSVVGRHTIRLRRLEHGMKALRASVTACQAGERFHCPSCFRLLARMPWRPPSGPCWWCAGCHQWIALAPLRTSENFKIDSARILGSPNDHAGRFDTQATQTHETGVARE